MFLPAADHYDSVHQVLSVLLGLNGIRVSEVCETNVEDLAVERGHRVLGSSPSRPTDCCRSHNSTVKNCCSATGFERARFGLTAAVRTDPLKRGGSARAEASTDVLVDLIGVDARTMGGAVGTGTVLRSDQKPGDPSADEHGGEQKSTVMTAALF